MLLGNKMYKIRLATDLHKELIDHYKSRKMNSQSRYEKIQLIPKESNRHQDGLDGERHLYQSFLRNQQHISAQPDPLDFRELPRNLKVFFPGPPKPPPPLEQIPYTHEAVDPVPFKIPKQRRGTVSPWVLQQSGFVQRRSRSLSQQKNYPIFKPLQKITEKKKSIIGKSLNNLFPNIKSRPTLTKKPLRFSNSNEFFQMIKKGEKEAQFLLEANPYLAYDTDQLKMTALHWTASLGYSYLTKTLLQRFRANPQAKDLNGHTPLHLAVIKKKISCLARIFVEGGDLNSLDKEKKNALSLAPDIMTRHFIEKLQQIKFIIRSKGFRDPKVYCQQLQKHVKFIIDESSFQF